MNLLKSKNTEYMSRLQVKYKSNRCAWRIYNVIWNNWRRQDMLESPCNYEIHLKIRNEHYSRQSCKTKLFLCDNQLVELNWLSRSEWNIWLHYVLHSKWISLVNSYQACNLLSNLHRKLKILCNIIFSLFFYFGQRKMKCSIMVIYSTLPLLKMAIPWDFGIYINNKIEMIPTDNRHSTYSLSIPTFLHI